MPVTAMSLINGAYFNPDKKCKLEWTGHVLLFFMPLPLWVSFPPLPDEFHAKHDNLLRVLYGLFDEFMSRWHQKTSKTGGLLNMTWWLRKQTPLGTMLRSNVEDMAGFLAYQEIVQGADSQALKRWFGEESFLSQNVAEVLWLCKGAKMEKRGWACEDACLNLFQLLWNWRIKQEFFQLCYQAA